MREETRRQTKAVHSEKKETSKATTPAVHACSCPVSAPTPPIHEIVSLPNASLSIPLFLVGSVCILMPHVCTATGSIGLPLSLSLSLPLSLSLSLSRYSLVRALRIGMNSTLSTLGAFLVIRYRGRRKCHS